jgi:hypothetical protein
MAYVPIDNGDTGASVRTKLNTGLALADTAVQPAALGTAAAEDVGYFATAAQGAKADAAAPSSVVNPLIAQMYGAL